MDKRVYLDHAATTAVHPAVLEAMKPALTGELFGNPSSVHFFGREAKKALDKARNQAADALGAKPEEIFFTAGGSEADNWALTGVMAMAKAQGKTHLITSQIEHHAILHTAEQLEKEGFTVTYLPVDADGLVDPEAVRAAITDKTGLVSIMFANNEIGTIEPIAAIGAICREKGVPFHTDAVQAVGAVRIDVEAMNIDLLSMSAHKIYGPKGVGLLYIRKGVRIANLINGGAQERGRRAGTENMPGIIGLGKAMELAMTDFDENNARLTQMRDALLARIEAEIPYVKLNGHRTERLPSNLNVSFRYIEGESLLLSMDLKGFAASSGSACTSGSLDPSHVLLAIGLPHEIAHGSLRMTLGRENTMEDVQACADALVEVVGRLRSMSPLYNEAMAKGE
ncbi:MAG: cysteine desulfurase NifS [Christensenellales bacterium]|jgi:cysteine desulfurase